MGIMFSRLFEYIIYYSFHVLNVCPWPVNLSTGEAGCKCVCCIKDIISNFSMNQGFFQGKKFFIAGDTSTERGYHFFVYLKV